MLNVVQDQTKVTKFARVLLYKLSFFFDKKQAEAFGQVFDYTG